MKFIRELQASDWSVVLIYLYLPDIKLSAERVAERVRHGGHDIPMQAILRRYPRSLNNLLNRYAPLCDTTICMDNSSRTPQLIFTQTEEERTIENHLIYQKLLEGSV